MGSSYSTSGRKRELARRRARQFRHVGLFGVLTALSFLAACSGHGTKVGETDELAKTILSADLEEVNSDLYTLHRNTDDGFVGSQNNFINLEPRISLSPHRHPQYGLGLSLVVDDPDRRCDLSEPLRFTIVDKPKAEPGALVAVSLDPDSFGTNGLKSEATFHFGAPFNPDVDGSTLGVIGRRRDVTVHINCLSGISIELPLVPRVRIREFYDLFRPRHLPEHP